MNDEQLLDEEYTADDQPCDTNIRLIRIKDMSLAELQSHKAKPQTVWGSLFFGG